MKIIINFSDLSAFPIFITSTKLDANFPSGLWPKPAYFFNFLINCFGTICQKNTSILAFKLGIQRIKSEKRLISVVSRKNLRSKLKMSVTKIGKKLKLQKLIGKTFKLEKFSTNSKFSVVQQLNYSFSFFGKN